MKVGICRGLLVISVACSACVTNGKLGRHRDGRTQQMSVPLTVATNLFESEYPIIVSVATTNRKDATFTIVVLDEQGEPVAKCDRRPGDEQRLVLKVSAAELRGRKVRAAVTATSLPLGAEVSLKVVAEHGSEFGQEKATSAMNGPSSSGTHPFAVQADHRARFIHNAPPIHIKPLDICVSSASTKTYQELRLKKDGDECSQPVFSPQ